MSREGVSWRVESKGLAGENGGLSAFQGGEESAARAKSPDREEQVSTGSAARFGFRAKTMISRK
jgi:hypothetical protein